MATTKKQIGYVMGQMHREKKRINLCVADCGVGIYGSLKNSKHCPRNAIDGVTMALQEKITRDENIGQGNGMWGLGRIVTENGGTFEIQSNAANLLFKETIYALTVQLRTYWLKLHQ